MKRLYKVIADKFLLFLDWMSPFDRVVCGEYNGTYFFYSFLLVIVLVLVDNIIYN